MSESKLHEQDNVPEDIWTLVKQLRIRDFVNAIKQIVLDDCQHLVNVARGRALNLETVTLLFKEFVKTRTGRTTLVTLAVVVGIITFFTTPFLESLGFTSTGPASEPVTVAAQSTFGVDAMFRALQGFVMDDHGLPIVTGIVQGVVAACVMFAAYKLWNMRQRKITWVWLRNASLSSLSAKSMSYKGGCNLRDCSEKRIHMLTSFASAIEARVIVLRVGFMFSKATKRAQDRLQLDSYQKSKQLRLHLTRKYALQ